MASPNNLAHGGRLNEAVRRWRIPREQWLDLSTGINPVGWPIPSLPASVWQRLPEDDDGLERILKSWAQAAESAGVLPVPGSQAAIQGLPRLRARCRVGVPAPGYEEHGRCWALAGHDVVPVEVAKSENNDDWLDALDVLVWIHPNNPTGLRVDRETLLHWHDRLQSRGGWLVVDEAFLLPDETTHSLAPFADRPGLLVLKSIGKFFGLAGLRAGALFGESGIVDRLASDLGPWAVSGPARAILTEALTDIGWQTHTAGRLRRDSERLAGLLAGVGLSVAGGTALFQYVVTEQAVPLADQLAARGILMRRFETPTALRFGLPGVESEWARLERAFCDIRGAGSAGHSFDDPQSSAF
ncbi:threonine-phosphate decarboxylase CobD [Marinobacter mangrovi]|uniref:threonine-phosphate decarboxylase CobD n=1 Tax=Marinobacter mangrovi TaxID=2803918 RepID=UPI00193165D8|nr:threonine-phosphate decarboxylase CobD [Marinobacter mangrovi]